MVISVSIYSSAAADTFDARAFSEDYFIKWVDSQMPNAESQELEAYLRLLTEDVALQHLPYDLTDTREAGGKQVIREGMTYWLGANTLYQVDLIDTTIGQNVIILKYEATIELADPATGEKTALKRNSIDVLELDEGKVSIIRKYNY